MQFTSLAESVIVNNQGSLLTISISSLSILESAQYSSALAEEGSGSGLLDITLRYRQKKPLTAEPPIELSCQMELPEPLDISVVKSLKIQLAGIQICMSRTTGKTFA